MNASPGRRSPGPGSWPAGGGLDELRGAIDEMLAAAPPPERDARPRQFVDRVFTIRGAGTVVTGTLTGGPLHVGQAAEILPSGHHARIRGLQTHKRSIEVARPVSRVAVNLAGTPREDLERGDALVLPGQWKPSSVIDAAVEPVRGLDHPLTSRGAYKFYAGSAERDVRIRFLTDGWQLKPPEGCFARIVLARPVALDLDERFVIREAGRRETVAGGRVLDLDPPQSLEAGRPVELARIAKADRQEAAWLALESRASVRSSALFSTMGVRADAAVERGALAVDAWLVSPTWADRAAARIVEALRAHHAAHPLLPGMEVSEARALFPLVHPGFGDLVVQEGLLEHLVRTGQLAREGTAVRLPEHRPSTAGREDADRLVEAVRRAEPSAPSVRELIARGFGVELIRAVCAEGRLVRVSAEILVTPDLLQRAEAIVREYRDPPGITVSKFREALGTSRKYALPILEYFDAQGVTRRVGDVRIARS